ncbi:MAG: hypothetical protein FWC47_02005 [Oscillospiraceae bacterium]|nr:hypothetical protein [Oscillospiraceae bacterium]
MKYTINLYFDKDSREYLEKLQKELSRKYRINKFLPSQSIRLGTVEAANLDKLIDTMVDFISPYKYFKIYVENACILENPAKIILAMILDKGYISRIERQINECFVQNGFTKAEPLNKLGLFILLSSNMNFDKKINFNFKDYEMNLKSSKKEFLGKYLLIEGLEIIKSGSFKKDAIIKKIKLKEY